MESRSGDFDIYGHPSRYANDDRWRCSCVVRVASLNLWKGNCIRRRLAAIVFLLVNGKGTVLTVGGSTFAAPGLWWHRYRHQGRYRDYLQRSAGLIPAWRLRFPAALCYHDQYVGGTFISPTGTTPAWTVCTAGLTTTKIRLCLNDQTTQLTTTGAGGSVTVTYGRTSGINGICSVPVGCRFVQRFTLAQVSFNLQITVTDATTPITMQGIVPGFAMVLHSEEVRWRQYLAGSCDERQFEPFWRRFGRGTRRGYGCRRIRATNLVMTNGLMRGRLGITPTADKS
jgi:hypothetical protein